MSPTTEGPVILETDAGPLRYTIMRSSRRKKTLELRVEPGGVVVVAAPVRISRADIEGFIIARTAWIQRRIATRGAEPNARFENGTVIPFGGGSLALEVRTGGARGASVERDGEILRVTVPRGQGGGEHVRAAVERWLREQVLALVTERVAARSAEMGVLPAGIRIANQKRRWGSCSPTGVLRFNWRLATVSDEVLDYVVVHELAHLRHMNHSTEFWAFVASALPGHQSARKRLRESRPSLFF